MRGAQAEGRGHDGPQGIIPADAGSTFSRRAILRVTEDHPRGCGEHQGQIALDSLPGGSSPRMRGAPLDGVVVHVVVGIIPADAGSTRRGCGR